MTARPLPLVFALGVAWLSACDKEEGEGNADVSPLEACELIIEACHVKDDGNHADVAECHSQAHDGEAGTSMHQEVCLERLDECVDICESAPAPEGEDGNSNPEAEEGDDRY